MAYHSNFNENFNKTVCGIPILPVKTKINGPAPNFI